MSSQPAEPAPKTKPPGCRKRNNPNDQGYRHDLYPQEKEAQRQIALCFDRAGEYPLPPPETPKRDFKEKTMPLIVEDGTLPAGANSFASVADADAYHAARLTAAWTDELAEVQKEAALIRASDWLNRKGMWNGRKASRSQRMAWPRAGVSTQDGEIAPDEIPAEVVEACCELAGFFVEQDYLAPLDRGGDIASLSVDVISIAYNGTAPAETVFPSLSGLLAGLGTVNTGKGGGIMEVGRG